VECQLHALVTLPPVPAEQEAVWAPQLVWKLLSRATKPLACGIHCCPIFFSFSRPSPVYLVHTHEVGKYSTYLCSCTDYESLLSSDAISNRTQNKKYLTLRILTWALDESGMSASCPGHFTPGCQLNRRLCGSHSLFGSF